MTVGRIPVIEGGIQPTIFDAKADLLTATAADTPARLAVGANGTVLKANSATATGLEWATDTGFANPMTTTGDTIYSSSGSTPARLGIGTAGQVLTVNGGGTAPSWATPAAPATTKNFTLLNTTTLNGASSYTVSSLSGYDIFYITLEDFSSTSSLFETSLQINGDSANHYLMGGQIYNPSSNDGYGYRVSTNNTSSMTIARGVSYAMAGIMIFGANTAGQKPVQILAGTNGEADTYGNYTMGRYGGTSVVSSIRVFLSSGNFDTGTMRIFGAI